MIHTSIDAHRARRGLLFFIALSAGCAGVHESGAEVASEAITRGTATDEPDLNAVVALDTGCTGTFIHPNYILTAAHCIPMCTSATATGCLAGTAAQSVDGTALGIDGPLSMLADDRMVPVWGQPAYPYYSLDRVWFPRAAEYDGQTPPDVAVLHSVRPFGGRVIPVMPWGQLPTSGSICSRWDGYGVDIVGYSDNLGADDSRRRRGRFDVTCDVRDDERAFLMEPGGATGSTTCAGDSGGGVLWFAGGRRMIGAVHSYGQPEDEGDDCHDGEWRSGDAFIPRHMLERIAIEEPLCAGLAWDDCVAAAERNGRIASVSRASNTMEIFWVAPDGSVQGAYWYEGMPGWARHVIAPAGSASLTTSIAATSRFPSTMQVFWVAPDGSVQDAHWEDGMTSWSRSQVAPPGSASTTTAVAATSRHEGTMQIFWVTPDGAVRDAWWYSGMTSWTSSQIAPPRSASVSTSIAATSRFVGTMEIFWVGPDGSVQDAYWYEGMPTWSRYPVAVAGSASAVAGVSATSRRRDTLEIWWVTPNGAVRDAHWYEGMSWWREFELAPAGSASSLAPVESISRRAETLEIWWVAPNGSVQDAYWYEGMWGWARHEIAPAGSAAPSDAISSVSRQARTMEVWWAAPDGSIEDAYWYEGMPGWARFELAPAGSAL